MSSELYHALIRTHHITSRRKVSVLTKAARKHSCLVLLRSGASPGLMYCEGMESSVNAWVSVVEHLRYKDFHMVARPAPVPVEIQGSKIDRLQSPTRGIYEYGSIHEFAGQMSLLGLQDWWATMMGYK
ncbi:hypothetical protein P152DRAFT_23128 [Eremomyces bilateralis CBS 781.70]|uniref:Uncharacterized protein n=1 Tax=Eremomyces bilateralis CBS 781.70 TaxID=1392243 RepID=A0A6G1GHI2_9PEZI|nr:uncharacterized protein P152DRAFT_23128 [Eremomyces bilateralis CBS 781.70]KAF1817555.1 hypothetical protein P152DRAFT_23128 [Eremomyces bilateralis CBS 781.70]